MSSLVIHDTVCLQQHNTLAVPASSRWFARVDSEQQLKDALDFRQQQQCELLILGGGSNVVLDDHFPGLCLQINLRGIRLEKETHQQIFLSVAAGENWHETVMYCVNHNYYGLENLALIPGSVGAAPIQNIGAYGVELEQCFSYLEAIDIGTGNILQLDKKSCEFAYRDSIFKHRLQDKVVITRVVLSLSKSPLWFLEYPVLKKQLQAYKLSQLTASIVVGAVIAIRQSKLPDPGVIPNVGSFFKNPIVGDKTYQSLKQQYSGLVAYPQGNKTYKLAAGWLLENAGWRGRVVNGIAMHEKQALVLTNPKRVSAVQLLEFVNSVKQDIYSKYQVELDIEPRIFGQSQQEK
ncbi:UDP-N-acetylenolpyruvoylglucosamine reductase [Candidatus Endobugula sertula]|uniref:UDP-N-acetylenolpyruvoylglucosamine reductase n=1 Tax=Candidatus Endobugula sertula TaxID=62101 RepID=A0A1D2QR65_9GAMM|nr:UDP-N-acetylenolpyruvoylglucosamine reductase [Candidatus Endobugula sertula]